MAKNSIKILGDLESEVMEIVWTAQKASVREVLFLLEKKRKIAYTTVMTVMSRLHEKKILKREMDKSGAFVYLPAQDKKSFLSQASKRIIQDFMKEYGDLAVAQFMDAIEAIDAKRSPEWKDKLRDLVK